MSTKRKSAPSPTATKQQQLPPRVLMSKAGKEPIRHEKTRARLHSCAALLWLSIFSIYVSTLNPTVVGGDSGELLAAACELGVGHPPGYPTFLMLARAAMHLFAPLGGAHRSPAWRVNLLNAILTASGAAVLFYTACLLLAPGGDANEQAEGGKKRQHDISSASTAAVVNNTPLAGIIVSAVCALIPQIWYNAVTAEVFGLNNLCTPLLFLLVVKFARTAHELGHQHVQMMTGSSSMQRLVRLAYVGAFFCGFAATNQHTIILFEIPIVLWVLWSLRTEIFKRPTMLLNFVLCYALGLTPYAYMPLTTLLNMPAFSWGHTSSWGGFWFHFFRVEYGTFDLSGKGDSRGLLFGLWYFAKDFQAYTLQLGVPMLLLGAAVIVLRQVFRTLFVKTVPIFVSRLLVPLVCSASLYLWFFHWRANLDILHPAKGHMFMRFWMQPAAPLLLLAALGLHLCISWLSELVATTLRQDYGKALIPVSLSVLLLALMASRVAHEYPKADESENTVFADVARFTLKNLPPNAILMISDDPFVSGISYVHHCERYRDDVAVIVQPYLQTGWYVPGSVGWHLASDKGVVFPSIEGWNLAHKNGFSLKQFVQANYDRGVFVFPSKWFLMAPEGGEHNFDAAFGLVPHANGLAGQYVKHGQGADYTRWLNDFKSESVLTTDLRLPSREKYSTHTWERWAMRCTLMDSLWNKHLAFLKQVPTQHPLRADSLQLGLQLAHFIYDNVDRDIFELPGDPTGWRGAGYLFASDVALFSIEALAIDPKRQRGEHADKLAADATRIFTEIAAAMDAFSSDKLGMSKQVFAILAPLRTSLIDSSLMQLRAREEAIQRERGLL